ncbi:MAG: hypothetical protein Q7R95_01440, partial [bacterium]|nr:hypothetical protein [bacterium]
TNRSPSVEWWTKIIQYLINSGYSIYHFGYLNEPELSNSKLYNKYTELSFFEQVKISLSTKLTIGTDSGAMWVMGAYSHPAIHLMTYWLPNHNKNQYALCPINENGLTFFNEVSIDNILIQDVVNAANSIMGDNRS